MKTFLLCALCVLCGCETPGDPRFWYDHQMGEVDGFFPYHVHVTVSDPGCRIEVNGALVASLTDTEGEIILMGDRDGRFRGNQYTYIVANPVKAGQHQQHKIFDSRRDRHPVPHNLYFDLNLIPPAAPAAPLNENIIINQNRR